MEYSILLQELKNKFENSILSVDETADIFTITIAAEAVKEMIIFLKEQFRIVSGKCHTFGELMIKRFLQNPVCLKPKKVVC